MDLTEWQALLPEEFRQRLQLVKEFTEGMQGRVFLCEDLTMRRRVVFKISLAQLDGDVTTAQRFEHEVRLLSALSHPHIVRLFDGQATGSDLFLITEYIDGPTLQSAVDVGGPPGIVTSLKYMLEICDGLESAHQGGIVHRDLKPKNILIDPMRGPVIIDFGLARSDRTDRAITSMGDVVGTPLYMAPEVIMSRPATVASDIYALGLILHFMLSGEPAFSGRDLTSTLEAQINEPTPRLEGIPGPLQVLVDRCVAKVATDRPQTCPQLVEELLPIIVSTPGLDELHTHPIVIRYQGGLHILPRSSRESSASPSGSRKKRRDLRHKLAGAAVLGGAIVGLFALGYSLGREETGAPPVRDVHVTPGAPGQATVSGTCEPCDGVRIRVGQRDAVPVAVQGGVFEEPVDIDPFEDLVSLEITAIRRGIPGAAATQEIKVTELAEGWRQNLLATLSRSTGRILPRLQSKITPAGLTEIRKDLEELSILSRTSSIHLLEKYLNDPREPIADRMTSLRQIASLLESTARLTTEDIELPDWERPLWVFPVRFLLERPFASKKRVRRDLEDPHQLITRSSMLAFSSGQYTAEIKLELPVERLPSRAMLVLQIYKFPRDLALEVSLNGHALPRCVMRVDWKGRGDDAKTRHHLELLPGILRVGTNQVVVSRRSEGESRSLEPVNVDQIGIEYDL